MKRTITRARPIAELQHAYTLSPEEICLYIGRSKAYVYNLFAEGVLTPVSSNPKMCLRSDVEAVARNGFKAVGDVA